MCDHHVKAVLLCAVTVPFRLCGQLLRLEAFVWNAVGRLLHFTSFLPQPSYGKVAHGSACSCPLLRMTQLEHKPGLLGLWAGGSCGVQTHDTPSLVAIEICSISVAHRFQALLH